MKDCVSRSKIPLMKHQIKVVEYMNNHKSLLVVHGTGCGKCEGYNTPNLMYDGTIKMVQDIVVGDLLMGPDSKPRNVLSLGRGKDIMYDVVPNKGEVYTFNSEHILSLKCTNIGVTYFNNNNSKKWCANWLDNKSLKIKSLYFHNKESAENYLKNFDEGSKICNVSIKDYIKLSKNVKHVLKLYRTAVDFPNKDVPFDPYIIGLWIGDGSSSSNEITTQDSSVIIYLKQKLPEYNMHLDYPNKGTEYLYRIAECDKNKENIGLFKKFNRFTQILRDLNLLNNKHIPDLYKINSREIRLKLLAGLLDSDGHFNNGCYEFTQKNETTMDGVVYLARSLGFSCYKSIKKTSWIYKGIKKYSTAFRISISGNIEEIPCKILRKQAPKRRQIKDVLSTGFKIVEKGLDDYYGFTLDGDHLYLLEDFTVTHNTLTALTVSQCYLDNFPKNNVIVVSPASLVKNFEKEMKKYGSVITENYKFYSFEKFVKENKIVCKDSMIIIDEAHNIRSMKTRYSEIFKCVINCDKLLLLTATPFVNSLFDFRPLINLLYRDEYVYKHTDVEYDSIFDKLYRNYVNYNENDVILRKIKKLLDRKISFAEKESSYFPDVTISKIDFTMSSEMYKKYAGLLKDEEFGKSPEVFFSGYRQAVNVIGTENYLNQKMEFINGVLKENKKTIIYTNWLESGVGILLKNFSGYKPSVISGNINLSSRLQIVEDYNSGKSKVLILTKAGSEGLDLKETGYIIVLDPVWNMATLDQIIGRGVRYKSHYNLPKKEQIVKVFLMILKTPKGSFVPSGDELLYNVLQKKLQIKNEVEKTLKEISI